jgi:hypothetical protein
MTDHIPKPGESALEQAKLRQERELRERELSLKEKELELRREQQIHDQKVSNREIALKENEYALQREQSWWVRWSTPAVTAILAGLIGYAGTLYSNWHDNQQEKERQVATLNLERQKQEGTLILEAIKTGGTAEERERLTAANLVFLADAQLITSIKPETLEKLRAKAGSAVPSLPAAGGVEFSPSPMLTTSLQSQLATVLKDYQAYLARLGYDVSKSKTPVTVRIDEEARGNAYFDNHSVVLGPDLAQDPEYTVTEYTWYVLRESNPRTFEVLLRDSSPQFQGFAQGLKFYFTCSYLNEPLVGRRYYELTGRSNAERRTGPLFDLGKLKVLDRNPEPHHIGEVWGGAFWELREKFGRERADRWIYTAWRSLSSRQEHLDRPKYLVDRIVASATSDGGDVDPEMIREVFSRRNLGH